MDMLLGVSLLTFVASVVGTLSGFGTSTIMVAVLSSFLPLSQTLLFVGIVHIFADLWKMLLFRKGFDWKLIKRFGIPSVVASIIGAWISLGIAESVLVRVMGAFLAVYGTFIIVYPAFKVARRRGTAETGGLLSGLVAGLFGIGGPIRGAFLTAYDLPKAVYISTAGAIAFATDIVRVATYVGGGTAMPGNYGRGLPLFIAVSFVGAVVAQKIVNAVSQATFRRIVAVFLALVGLKFLLMP